MRSQLHTMASTHLHNEFSHGAMKLSLHTAAVSATQVDSQSLLLVALMSNAQKGDSL